MDGGARYEQGLVTYMGGGDVNRARKKLQAALQRDLPDIEFAYIKPEGEQVRRTSSLRLCPALVQNIPVLGPKSKPVVDGRVPWPLGLQGSLGALCCCTVMQTR